MENIIGKIGLRTLRTKEYTPFSSSRDDRNPAHSSLQSVINIEQGAYANSDRTPTERANSQHTPSEQENTQGTRAWTGAHSSQLSSHAEASTTAEDHTAPQDHRTASPTPVHKQYCNLTGVLEGTIPPAPEDHTEDRAAEEEQAEDPEDEDSAEDTPQSPPEEDHTGHFSTEDTEGSETEKTVILKYPSGSLRNNTPTNPGGIYSQDISLPPQVQTLERPPSTDHYTQSSALVNSQQTLQSKTLKQSDFARTPLYHCDSHDLSGTNSLSVKRTLHFTESFDDNVSMSDNVKQLFSGESQVDQIETDTDNNRPMYDGDYEADRPASIERVNIDPHTPHCSDTQAEPTSAYEQSLTALCNQVDQIFKQAIADFKHIEKKVYEQQTEIRQLFDELEAYEHGSNSDLNLQNLISVARDFQTNLIRGQQQLHSIYSDSDLPAFIDKASEYLSDDTTRYVEHYSELLTRDFEYINSVFEENLAILSAFITSIQEANHANRLEVAQSTQTASHSYPVHDLSHKPLGVQFSATPGIFRARSASPQPTKVRRVLPPTPPKPQRQTSHLPVPHFQETANSPFPGFRDIRQPSEPQIREANQKFQQLAQSIPDQAPPADKPIAAPAPTQQATSIPPPKPYIPDTHSPSPPPQPPAQHYITAPAVITEQPTQLPAQHYSPARTAATRQSRRTLFYSPALFYSPGEHSLNAGELRTTRDNKTAPRSNMAYATSNNGPRHGAQSELVDQITTAFQNMQVNSTARSATSPTNYSLRHIPTFAGNASDDFEEWRRKFLNKIAYLTWPAEQQILLLDDALTDRANLFYRKLPAAAKQSMTHILKALEKQYGNENMDLAERAMQRKRKQMPGESIEDYTSAILKLVHRLRMDKDIDQVALYIDGLDPAIQGDVYRMKPNTIDQAEKDARLASSTMSRKAQDLTPKELAAELIVAMNKNVAEKAAMAAMTGADQYTVFPQTPPPIQSSQYFQQPMPNMIDHTATVAYATPPPEQQSQQTQYSQQQPNQQMATSPRQPGTQQNTQYRPRYRPQAPQQAPPQQPNSQQTWRNNNARPNTQNRVGNNQYQGNNGFYQNSRAGQYNNRQQQQNSYYNRPFQSTYRPYCRTCECPHPFGVHTRSTYNGQRSFERRPSTGNTRPQTSSN